jgi:hypothetical protein
VHELLLQQHQGEIRLRLILREAVDLNRAPKANPLWCWDYDPGLDAISCVAEIWIQTKDRRRRRVGERGFAR